jgi:hypothetical protein
MSEPQPLPGPAISGAFLTIGETTYFRHGGLWVPLSIPRLDFDALVDAAFDDETHEHAAEQLRDLAPVRPDQGRWI